MSNVIRIVSSIASELADFDVVATLREATERLRERHYALVILDLALPDGSGWSLIESLKYVDEPPPVLVFSATDIGRSGGPCISKALVKSRTSNADLVMVIERLLRQGTDSLPTRAA